MLTSVIIPCHDGIDDTRACLEALRAQRGAGALEILIVDNGSRDGTADLGSAADGIRVLRQAVNLGFAGGVNQGLRAARGDRLLVLNNDTRAAPHLLARLHRALDSDRRIGAVAPVSNWVKGPARLPLDGGGDADSCAATEGVLAEAWGGCLQDLDTLAGLCLLLRRELVQRVGLFDERFGVGNFEDDDFCLRARLLGYRLVVARDAFLFHRGHRTFAALGLDYRATLAERQRIFAAKWQNDPAGAAVLAERQGDLGAAAAHASDALRCHPRWPDGHWLRARWLAARGAPEAARGPLESFAAACPRHTAARVLLAFLQLEAGRERDGRRQLDAVLRQCFFTEVELAHVLARLGHSALAGGDAARAAALLASAVELEPEHAELHNALGAALMQAGQLEQALARLQQADRLGSAHGSTNTGICLWRLGRPVEALRALHGAAVRHPGDALARANLEAALVACGRREREPQA